MASDSKQAATGRGGGSEVVNRDSALKRGYASLKKADWTTFGALVIIVLLGAYLRFYFDFFQSIAGGFPSLSGGSDADFYFNVVSYALGTGHQLLFDPMLNYPIGSFNPFLPFYVWSTVLLTWPVSFFSHLPATGSIYSGQLTAGVVAYVSMSAISGTVAIVVTYYLGKELFSKEAGIIAAALMAFLPSIVSESTVGFGVHDPFVLMLTAVTFFFLFRALNSIKGTRWVERWNRKDSYLPDTDAIASGVTRYYRDNKTSLLYAALAGVVLAGIANAWEGYSYIIVTISLFYLLQSFIYKFKNRDTLALTGIYAVAGSVLMVLALPVYYNSNAIYPWYYVSFVFFLGTLILGVIYTVARDVPWLTLISALVGIALVLVGVVEIADPRIIHGVIIKILTAQSYFIKSAVYTTIAEAQTPPFSLLALSLGGAVFFIAFAEVAYIFYRSPKGLTNSQMLMIIWFLISAFMAVSTVRFVLDATTAFVLYAGEGIFALVSWTDFSEIRKGFQTYGTSWSGIRKSVKIKHVLVVIFVAFIVVMPVVWTGIDAATPSTSKSSLNSQVYDVLPGFLRPSGYVANSTASPFYFGAFGYSLETQGTYFPPAWGYLNNLTGNITPYYDRPGYLSWWDYGSAAITFAQVPTVADDFQQGYQLASAFLFSQNQTQAISLLVARVLQAAYLANGNALPQNLTAALDSAGINSTYVSNVLASPGSYKNTVLAHPAVYGPFASSVTSQNVMYAVLMVTISNIGLNSVVRLYQTVSQLTGKFIGFFSVDARLFPFSATNTGVFYAPAFLGGRPIAGPGVYNIPYNYYTLSATTSTGVSYPLQSVPTGSQVVSYNINYQPMFYNMTLYRFFMGYSAYDITGQNLSGLPGLSGNFLYNSHLTNMGPLPGWMESHFEMIYRTAYYNPYPLKYVKDHPNDWSAISLQKAIQLAKADPTFQNYTVDLSPQSDFQNGIVLMEYYPGAYVNGTVLMGNGQPAKNVRVTVLDQWGIPHDVVYTNSQGQYSAVAMQGNDTIVYSSGALTTATQNLTQTGTILKEVNLNVSYSQAMRNPTLNSSTGLPAYNINMGVMTLGRTSVTGHIYFTTPSNLTYTPGVTPPVLNVGVKLINTTTGLTYSTYAANGVYNFTSVLPGEYNIYLTSGKSTILAQPNVTARYNFTTPQNLALTPYYVVGSVYNTAGAPASGLTVALQGAQNNYSAVVTTAANGSYSFPDLLVGNYTVYVSSSAYTSSHYTISAVTLNYTRSHPGFNITALTNTELSGTVTVGGQPAPAVTLYFYSKAGGIQPFSAISGQSGRYSLSIASGNYTVYSVYYSGSTPYVVLSNISLRGGTATAGFSLSDGYPVTGTVTGPGGTYSPYAQVSIQAQGIQLNFTTNSSGGFYAILPTGSYGIWTSGSNSAYLGTFSVNGAATSMNIVENQASTFSGQVATAVSGLARNITGAQFTFSYGNFTYSTYSNLTGYYSITLPDGFNPVVQLSSEGMVSQSIRLTSGSAYRTISMYARDVQFSGSAVGSAVLPSSINMTLSNINGTVVTVPVTNGAYSATIEPGIYSVSFSGYNSSTLQYTVTAAESNITVPVGHDTVFNADVVVKYNTTLAFKLPSSSGATNTTKLSRIDIFSPALSSPMVLDNVANNTSVYLRPAKYTVYAYTSVRNIPYAFLNVTDVVSPSTYVLSLDPVLNLSGTVYHGSSTLSSATVYITASNGATVQAAVQSGGTFSVSLPSSVYTVNASYVSTMNESGRQVYVLYSGGTVVKLSTSENVDIQTSVGSYNSTVSGTASWFYSIPVQSQLKFIPIGTTGAAAETETAGNGSFSVQLSPGNYTVETYSSGGNAANVTKLTVLPGQNATFNPVLDFAYSVNGSVAVPGIGGVDASITFNGAGGNFTIPSPGGRYSVMLPGGNYSITASYNTSSDGTLYAYTYNSTAHISSPSQIPVVLSLLPTYSVDLTVLSAQQSQGASGFTSVSLLVNNTGDVPDIFYMSVDNSNWYGSFTPTYVVLGTGRNSSAIVNVTLSSSNPAGGYNNVLFSATSLLSPSANSTAHTSIQVPVSYGFSTAFSSYGQEKVGRTISFSVVVNNTGNTVSNYVASVSNIAGLNAEGWRGGIYTTSNGPFYNDTFFSLKPGQNQTLTISLTATTANPTSILPVGVNVTQKETGSSSAISVPISLPKPVVTLNGITVSGQGASVSPPPLISLKRAVVIFVLATLIVADVYYAKKRRLIR